jgi:diguanylate cyclase (GGDEF)-like protein
MPSSGLFTAVLVPVSVLCVFFGIVLALRRSARRASSVTCRPFSDFLPVARARTLECLSDGLVILDCSGAVADFNPAALALLGLPATAGRAQVAAVLDRPELSSLASADEGRRELVLPCEGVGGDGARKIAARAFRVTDELGRAVGISLVLTDITEVSMLVDKLAELASIDSLTGALNRRRFDEIGSRDFELARRAGQSVGVLMIDLDLFKRVNDEWGHAAGDEVLRAVCRRCGGALRSTDVFARYGGEEFAVILPDSDAAGARCAAERIRAAISSGPVFWEGRGISVTASVGVYAGIPVPGEGLEFFLRRADEALYSAKAHGRNRSAFWSPGRT